MIRNPAEVERVKRKHQRERLRTLAQKRALFDAMYEEVKQFGFLKSNAARQRKHKFAMARILNADV